MWRSVLALIFAFFLIRDSFGEDLAGTSQVNIMDTLQVLLFIGNQEKASMAWEIWAQKEPSGFETMASLRQRLLNELNEVGKAPISENVQEVLESYDCISKYATNRVVVEKWRLFFTDYFGLYFYQSPKEVMKMPAQDAGFDFTMSVSQSKWADNDLIGDVGEDEKENKLQGDFKQSFAWIMNATQDNFLTATQVLALAADRITGKYQDFKEMTDTDRLVLKSLRNCFLKIDVEIRDKSSVDAKVLGFFNDLKSKN